MKPNAITQYVCLFNLIKNSALSGRDRQRHLSELSASVHQWSVFFSPSHTKFSFFFLVSVYVSSHTNVEARVEGSSGPTVSAEILYR